ncbi:hypothetical protein KY285_022957 [Solanum tuberosum]|nr:hypothetical protein KY285_022957 [Solanum tuberosum]
MFDESSHQIEDLVHEFGMTFDLVADNLVGLQIPLRATRSVEPPLVKEDECLETKTNIVFDGRVDGYVSLIPHDNVAAIAEFFPFVFNQSSLANFGDLTMCESVTDGLPTCHWFDTGQHVSPFIPFVFRLTKYGHHVSATEFGKTGYRPIIGDQGAQVTIAAGTTQNIAWEGASHNWFLEMSRYILAIESGNSKMNQLFDAMSDKACKVFNVMSTSLLVRVLAETPKETNTIQQFHFKDRMFTDFFCWSRIYSVGCTFHTRPTKESTILEDVSKREIQSNDVKHVKFNEGIRHDECLFPVDPGENLFMVKLGGTVKVNCVWDPGISSKTMH